MSGKVTQFMKTQKYRFDFGADGKLYTTIFHGKIPQPELKGMVCSLQNCLYGKTPDVIFSYLKLHHLEFSDFHSMESTLGKDRAMGWAVYLLHSDTYGKMEGRLGDADFHYAVVDFQENTQAYSEGCYFAATRTAWGLIRIKWEIISFSHICSGLSRILCIVSSYGATSSCPNMQAFFSVPCSLHTPCRTSTSTYLPPP